jgi:hypothetical protein
MSVSLLFDEDLVPNGERYESVVVIRLGPNYFPFLICRFYAVEQHRTKG